jgi:hypothetical protein
MSAAPAGDAAAPALRCSARGCAAAASVDLVWRNPRLHGSARTKHWLACAAHADSLASFLDRRGFLLERAPLAF